MSDTVIRAVTIPVACPFGDDPAGVAWTWDSFNERLAAAFRLSTDLANWCVRRLFVLDDPASAACPDAVKKWYGYKDAAENYPRAGEWAGAMAGLNLVCRAVQRKYVQQRFDVMVRHDSSLLTYRFPQPYPVHNQNWKPEFEHGKYACVRISVPGVGMVALALETRAGFRRQLAMFRQLCDGTAKKGEAALYRDRKGNVLLKMVGRFPRRERGPATGVAFVHTDPGALLVVEVSGRAVKVTNADHIRREVAKHKAFLRRAGDDKKREVRMDRRHRANFDKAIDARCGKQADRLKTAIHQVAAQVARMCERVGVGLVAYDDSHRGFIPEGFPWHALKERLRQLLVGEMGCEWVDGQFTHLTDQKEKDEWLSLSKNTAAAGRKALAHKGRSGSHPAVTPNSPPKPCRPRRKSPGSAR